MYYIGERVSAVPVEHVRVADHIDGISDGEERSPQLSDGEEDRHSYPMEKNDRHIYHGQERSQTEGHAAEPATTTATADLQRLRK